MYWVHSVTLLTSNYMTQVLTFEGFMLINMVQDLN